MAAMLPYQPPAAPQMGIPLPGVGPAQGTGVSVGGILPILSIKDMEFNARRNAELAQNQPVVQGLAGHVRKCWSAARVAKQDTVELRMTKSLRQRRGEYEPDVAARIKAQQGSAIYMMLTSVKCRGAGSWLRDVLMGQGQAKPWVLKPTPMADLPPEAVDQVRQKAETIVQQIVMANGELPNKLEMYKLLTSLREDAIQSMQELAKAKVSIMERKMEDQLLEGGFLKALDQFIDDITTFPAAIMKGPVVRRKPKLKWVAGVDGSSTPEVQDDLVLEWERVDPFMAYPSPGSSGIDDGYFIERHKLRRGDLEALRGVEGYNDDAITTVLDEYGRGGLNEWLLSDSAQATAEGKNSSAVMDNSEGLIDAIQFWGSVSGKMLLEWGMSEEEIKDPAKEYFCEVWLIGSWVIKASLNYHPLGLKPYYKASYEDIPGAFWGNSVADLVRDCQDMCNSAARALANNMGIASGPQVSILTDRIPSGEDITNMYPWKIWQFQSDSMGGNAAPIEFFQPQSNANELMQIYEKFSVLADEYSGIPRYMTGDAPTGGAGRTASGMNMLMTNANKSMKQVVSNIDNNVFVPLLERQYFYNMKYSDDPQLKGDVQVMAQGAAGVLAKESAQVRRTEFLAATANPIDMQIVGMDGRASVLRKTAESLDMDPNEVVPSPERIRLMQQLMLMSGGMPGAAPQPAPTNMGSSPSPIQNGQTLENGAPIADHFSPKERG